MPAPKFTSEQIQQNCYRQGRLWILYLFSKSETMRKTEKKGIFLNAVTEALASVFRAVFQSPANSDFIRLKKFIC